MAAYLYEFLYRGRDGDTPPAWHLILRDVGKDAFGRPTAAEMVLNMAQAAAAGWALPKIVKEINADTLVESEKLRNDVAALQSALGDANKNIDALTQANTHLQGEITARDGRLVMAAADLAARDRSIAALSAQLAAKPARKASK